MLHLCLRSLLYVPTLLSSCSKCAWLGYMMCLSCCLCVHYMSVFLPSCTMMCLNWCHCMPALLLLCTMMSCVATFVCHYVPALVPSYARMCLTWCHNMIELTSSCASIVAFSAITCGTFMCYDVKAFLCHDMPVLMSSCGTMLLTWYYSVSMLLPSCDMTWLCCSLCVSQYTCVATFVRHNVPEMLPSCAFVATFVI